MSGLNPVDSSQLTVSTTAVGFTLVTTGRGTRPTKAVIYVANQPVRYRSFSAPTATAGIFVPANSYIYLMDPAVDYYAIISRMQFIRDTTAGADATLDYEFYGGPFS